VWASDRRGDGARYLEVVDDGDFRAKTHFASIVMTPSFLPVTVGTPWIGPDVVI
jgi:hypothetical protein